MTRGANASSYGLVGDGVTDDAAALSAALAEAGPHVFLHAGSYRIAAPVVGATPYQVIEFAPGAVLRMKPTGSVTFSGAHQRILSPRIEAIDTGITETFAPLLTLDGSFCRVSDLLLETGGRASLPTGALSIGGGNNVLEDPFISCPAARYGIFRKDLAEFLTIRGGRIQGRNNGTFTADSEGIYCGNFAGQLKMFSTAVIGFTRGVGIHGSHDAPTFVGCTIVNNETYCLVIDLPGAGGVRGLTFSGCYLADQIGIGFLHFVKGLVEGAVVTGCEIGFKGVGILCEDACAVGGLAIGPGNFVQGDFATAPNALIQPGANTSTVLYITGSEQSLTSLATGPYASRAVKLA